MVKEGNCSKKVLAKKLTKEGSERLEKVVVVE
jgi:hypothetical protein